MVIFQENFFAPPSLNNGYWPSGMRVMEELAVPPGSLRGLLQQAMWPGKAFLESSKNNMKIVAEKMLRRFIGDILNSFALV